VALRDILQKCNFVAPAINTIAEDRILQLVIMGINDQDVTEKLLQLNNTTTYAQATAQARSIIAAKRDAAKGTSSGAATSRVHTTARPPQTPAWIAPTTDRTGPCPQCGYNKHRGTS
jgi:ribosomal protein L12E/L44/L45/RPP1/RPP2